MGVNFIKLHCMHIWIYHKEIHVYNRSYSGGRGNRILSLRMIWAELVRPCLINVQSNKKWCEGTTSCTLLVIEPLLICKTLGSTFSTEIQKVIGLDLFQLS
jgi:hypothetical protein